MKQRKNLQGQHFGLLVVIKKSTDYISPKGQHIPRWTCQCECGKQLDIIQTSLISGNTSSCGCNRLNVTKNKLNNEMVGKTFGELTVLYRADDYISPKGARSPKWHCRCNCGNEIDVLGMSLKNGSTKSCGCKSGHTKKSVDKIDPYSLIGNSYGYLVVKECIAYSGKINNARFMCQCICGKEKDFSYSALKKNKNISCGCMTHKVAPTRHILPKSVIGERFGKLVVLKELSPHITPNGSRQRIVTVMCDCGNRYDVRLQSAQKTKQCRQCSGKETRNDILGQRFGKLTVIEAAEDYISPSGHKLRQWKCRCDCGNTTIVTMSQLITGKTCSCGCLLHTKGMLKDIPSLLDKYDFEKNIDIDINTLTARTSKKVWWKCHTCNNSWYATIASQNDSKKHGCPYCSGRLVIEGKTDLNSQSPELASEFDIEANGMLPSEISCNSSKKVWWHGKCGHKWKATVANRYGNHSGCPKCKLSNVSSFPEQAILYYIKQFYHDAIGNDKNAIGKELDIYIPAIKTAIEYDGEAWHRKNKEKTDNLKNILCTNSGIRLIRIREGKLTKSEGCINFHRSDATTDQSLELVIKELFRYLGLPDDAISIQKDTTAILSQYAAKKLDNSLQACNPQLASEWNYERNGNLTPEQIPKSTNRKVWWKCINGHEWEMRVCDRTRTKQITTSGRIRNPQGCPYCSGKRVLTGYNDLNSKYPDIAALWHPYKNGTLKPTDVTTGTSKKVWWLGLCGHEWESSIRKMCCESKNCPICYRNRKSPKVMCIETGIIYKNAQNACKELGKKYNSKIYNCCRGECKTVYGYHWQFA